MRGAAAGAGVFALPGVAGAATAAAPAAAEAEAGPPHRWTGAGPLTHVPAPGCTSLARRRQWSPGSLTCDAWDGAFGGPVGAPPVVAANADGRLEAFALSPGGARLDHRRQLDPGGAWAEGEEFGEPGVPLAAPPTADATGRLHVFAVTADGRIRTRVQERPSGGRHPWSTFGERLVAPLRPGCPVC
ncbi:hypothetical protein ACFY04_17430 [Streptomyces sp. NPDC001549]|uniref:hypothetical protein n=1 Tax=Streptomyces sp. NPDC001549 TaxID=3364586 RepID=UPI0036B2EE86